MNQNKDDPQEGSLKTEEIKTIDMMGEKVNIYIRNDDDDIDIHRISEDSMNKLKQMFPSRHREGSSWESVTILRCVTFYKTKPVSENDETA